MCSQLLEVFYESCESSELFGSVWGVLGFMFGLLASGYCLENTNVNKLPSNAQSGGASILFDTRKMPEITTRSDTANFNVAGFPIRLVDNK